MTDETPAEVYVLSKAEVSHIRRSIEGALEELEEFDSQNYYIRELQDSLALLRGAT